MSQVVLITGASSGIGAACAQYLATNGYRVYGTARKVTAMGSAVKMIEMDVDDEQSVRRGVETVRLDAGRIDVVINNAGFAVMGSIEETPIEEAKAQMETNFFGVLRVCQALLPIMRAQGSGIIINISSLAGILGLPFSGLYSATKFAVEGMTESLRLEVQNMNIKVVLVEPGDFRSALATRRRVVNAGPAYADFFARFKAVQDKDEASAPDPISVARRIESIIASRNPLIRYTVGMFSQTVVAALKRLLPQRIFETVIRLALPMK